MKNFIKILILLVVFSTNVIAQQEQQRGLVGSDNWLELWTEFTPETLEYNENTEIIAGNITEDITLYKAHTYLLVGNVFVTNNAILSIEPGTVIKGDFESKATLTITKGAGIIAEGTITDPIVFTSNKSVKKAGDWGGIVILGDGFTNKSGESFAASLYPEIEAYDYNHTKYGGESLKRNSGYLSYVRVEYAGGKAIKSNETNALLLAGVGAETTINNIMVSYSEGNSITVIGGEVNLDKMISFRAKNIDFNFDYGTKSQINNSLALRSPYVSYAFGDSKCIRVASYINEGVDFSKDGTEVVATNMTLLTDTDDLNYAINSGLVRESIYVGENTSFKIESSVISGFAKALLLNENIAINDVNLSRIQFKNVLFNNFGEHVFSEKNNYNKDLENWYANPYFSNTYSKTSHSLLFKGLNNSRNRDYRLRVDEKVVMNNNLRSTK
ncbi:hypothetical protein [Mariniflexile sp.]|uniref:hypothetical protein n=1 Tax=Mariniflexile sp. TaxID=1979402 RepID=UPI003561FAA1